MKFLINLPLMVIVPMLLTGCIVVGGLDGLDESEWHSGSSENRRIISELEIGADRRSVVERLGAPHMSEASVKNGDEFRILFYRTKHRHFDADTSKDETTPLVFKNDKLIGWGDELASSIL